MQLQYIELWKRVACYSELLTEYVITWGGTSGKKDRDDRRKSKKTTLKNTKP